ncbi:M28 family peptidase [Bremerella sp. P1]|uniref:M28 family peptidase n=1 Tax=Bremerella sp. P1 TaxID=3026424 RepID=UPI002368B3C1|nr:M28 family peptidase [Bremerella sp. P1]WDI42745.1 M28 family peptidase [Bremerella sp. P1]
MPQPSLTLPSDQQEQRIPLWSTLVAGMIGVIAIVVMLALNSGGDPAPPAANVNGPEDLSRYLPFDGEKAYEHLKDICALGPRVSGSPAMQKQQQMIEDHLSQHGATVVKQSWEVRHPETGQPVTLTNLFGRFHPDRTERILLCCHYDTRPYADEDPDNPKAPFLGANDGASGAAALMELTRHLGQLDTKYGIDVVFLDAEEFIFDKERDPFFLGSTYLAQKYRSADINFQYKWGILLDMVGDKDLQIYQERNSLSWKDTRPLVIDIWRVANRLNIPEFVRRPRHTINDDHVPLHDIGGIPIIDIIDFDFPSPGYGPKYWHTQQDVPENCSAASLAKVGKVVLTWLQEVE